MQWNKPWASRCDFPVRSPAVSKLEDGHSDNLSVSKFKKRRAKTKKIMESNIELYYK